MKRTNGNIDFILFGGGNYNTLGALHCMATKGVEVFLLLVGSGKRPFLGEVVGYSKYARYGHVVETEEEGLEWLLSHQMEFPHGTVIYPTSDVVESLLDCNYRLLSRRFIFPNCGVQGEVTRLMEKDIQTAMAMQYGIRTLQSLYTNKTGFDIDEVAYPCMVKPLISISGSKDDMSVCFNRKDLDEAITSAKHTKEFIIQHYIYNEADLLFLGVRFPNGEVWIPSLVKKPGVSELGAYTNAIITTDVETHLPELKQVLDFVNGLNYIGPFSVEFGLEKGQNYFFEINLRNDGTSHYPLSFGINIPYVYYQSCKGKLLAEDISFLKGEYAMIDEFWDIRRVLSHEISLSQWWRLLRSAKAYRYYTSHDCFPALMMAPVFLYRMILKIFKSLFRP